MPKINILGISCFYHDSAACLVRDGEIVAAAQEERFTREKHDSNFPKKAIEYCLKEGQISLSDIDCIVFYEKPLIKFERLLETYLAYAPKGIDQFIQAMPIWLHQKLWIPDIICRELNYKGKILFCGHHESHAASAFYPSPFKNAAFLTLDGVGEWETASFGTGCGNKLDISAYLKFPHSLGLLYSAFTYYCGFRVNSGEYKLMGLAPYGEPKYTQLILDNLLDLKDDGSFKLNMKYFGYCYGFRMTNKNFAHLFGLPARKPETKISQKYMDIAASIQKVTEEIVLKMAQHVREVTKQDNLCLAGGVALNCVANGKIMREGPFKNIWIQPASGDAGGALGAALLIYHKYYGKGRDSDEKNDKMKGSFLGPAYSNDTIAEFLKSRSIPYKHYADTQLSEVVAEIIANEKVVGWMQGRMEFGPRALGGRSIIGDARSRLMQSTMNLKIKYRESFRPFAPTIIREHVSEWFELTQASPYMLLVAPVKKEKCVLNSAEKAEGFEKLKTQRSAIPAVTHVDYSARIQTIERKDNSAYYDVIAALYKKIGCPAVINTSFNVRGEPLVCTPEDAYRCFMRTEMDYLVLGNFVLDKKEQSPVKKDTDWQKTFELD